MFYSRHYKGLIPAVDISFIISGTAKRWAEAYGRGISCLAWKGILEDGYVESLVKDRRKFWQWIDYLGE